MTNHGIVTENDSRSVLPLGKMIPVISMWQPYASLLFAWDSERGDMAKAFETRGWAMPDRLIGERIAIHATKAFAPNSAITPELNDLCYELFGCSYNFSLPRAAIIGVASFAQSRRSEIERPYQPSTEIAAGDWSDGRWVWPVMSADLLREPIPAKGKQGWWRYDRSEVERLAA